MIKGLLEQSRLALAVIEGSQDCFKVLGLDGRLRYMNAFGRRAMAVDDYEALEGVFWPDAWPEPGRTLAMEAVEAAGLGKSARFVEQCPTLRGELRTWDVSVYPLYAEDGSPTGIAAVSRDVTDYMRLQSVARALEEDVDHAARELQSKDAFLRSASRIAGVAGFEVDLVQGTVHMSAEARAILGVSGEEPRTLEETLGRYLRIDRSRLEAQLAALIAEQAPKEFIGRAMRDDGVQIWVRISGEPVTREGVCVAVRGAMQDVTDLKQVEMRQRRLNRRLARARKRADSANQAKSAFLANMSHEIRTPLNGVVAVAEVLSRTSLDERQSEMVDLIRSSGASLEGLLSDVLDLARIEAGQTELEIAPFELARLVQEVGALAGLKASEKGVGFRTDVSPALERSAEGDALRLKQVLTNLLSNAVKFTERGEVVLTVDLVDAERDVVEFRVADTGVGFTEEMRERLFDRFQQADASVTRRFGGTGLGLAICRELVLLMGGTIACDSRAGEGSVFVVRLPLPKAEDAAGPNEHEPDHPGACIPCRVLLADDHPVNRKVIELILGSTGADLIQVEDGAQALSAYERGAFDVVLMDMQMPVMDGLTATRGIRALEARTGRPRTPVLMLTANALPDHEAEALRAGADQHFSKPIDAGRLLAAIATAIKESPHGVGASSRERLLTVGV